KEAWFVDHDGHVTEGSSSNAWIVTKGGMVVTRPADNGILRGITRSVLLDVIKAQGLKLEERPFTVEEAYGAREAFLTSASQIVMPVVRIDDRPVGNGAPVSVAIDLRTEFHRHAEWAGAAPILPLKGMRCSQLVLARFTDVPCNSRVRVVERAEPRKWARRLGNKPRGKGPASEKMDQRQWRPTAHKTFKTPSSIM